MTSSNRKYIRRLLASALLLANQTSLNAIAMESADGGPAAAPPATVSKDSSSTVARTGIRLFRTEDGSVRGELPPDLSRKFILAETDRIVKISDTYTKGQDLAVLQELLCGPVGTKLTVEILSTRSGELSVLEVPIEPLETKNKNAYSVSLGPVDCFDRPNLFRSNKMIAEHSAKRGIVSSAGAVLRDILNHCPYIHPSTTDAEVLTVMPFAIDFFDRSGMFEESDRAIQLTIKLASRNLKTVTRSEIRSSVEIADYLAKTGRPDDANKILSALNATVSDARSNEQITILTSYSKLLDKNRKLGGPEKTLEKLESVCRATLNRQSFTGLQTLIDYYNSTGNYQKSEELLNVLFEAQQNNLGLANEVSHYLRYQEPIDTLRQLAILAASRGKYSEARSSLDKALAIYSDKLKSDEVIRLERSTNLCYSEIELQIGKIYLLEGNYEKAMASLNSAASRIKDALGEKAPQLANVFIAKAETYEKQGDQPNAKQSRSLARQLPPLNLPSMLSSTSQDLDWLPAKQAYELIRKKQFDKALSIVHGQLQQAEKQTPQDPYQINRLICLAKAFDAASRTADSLLILEQLSALTSREELNAMHNSVLAELFCLLSTSDLKQNRTRKEQIWNELRQNLASLEEAAFPGFTAKKRWREFDLAVRERERLRRVALQLRFLGAPQKAEVILRKILENKEWPQLDDDVKATLMLAQIESGDFTAANEIIGKEGISHRIFEKLFQAVDAYLLVGEKSRAEQLVSVIRNELPSRKLVDRSTSLQLASLETKLGQYKSAIANFKTANSEHSIRVVGGRDFGFALEQEGIYDEAINTYIDGALHERERSSGDDHISGFFEISQALRLVEKQDKVSAEAMKNLAAFLARTPKENESVAMSEQIVRIAKKQSAIAKDPVMSDSLRQILQHENQLQLASKISSPSTASGDEKIYADQQSIRFQIDDAIKSGDYEKAEKLIISFIEADSRRLGPLMMPHPGNRMTDLYLFAFEKANRLDISERLLRKAIQLEPTRPNQTLWASLLNKVLLVKICAQQGKATDALTIANEVMKSFAEHPDQLMSRGSPDCYSSIESIFWGVDAFIANKDLDSAKHLNDSIEKFLTTLFGSKNSAQIRYFERCATIYGAQGNKEKQEEALANAFRIACWNWGADNRKITPIRMSYASILRDRGKTTEADRVEAIRTTNAYSRIDEITLYGPDANRGSHSPPPDVYADTAEAALQTQMELYSALHGEIGKETIETIDSLTDFYLARKKYEQSEKLVGKKLELWKDVEGACSDFQSQCMEQLAEIAYLKGDRQAATSWLDKAERANVFGYSDNNLRCAALRLEMGDQARGLKLLLHVAEQLQKQGANSFDQTFAQCAYLLTQTRQTQELKKLDDIYENANKNKSAGWHGWWHKRTNPVYEKKAGVWTRTTRASRELEQMAERSKHMPSPAQLQSQAMRSQLEHLRRRVPPNIGDGMVAQLQKSLDANDQRAKDLEANRIKQEQLDQANLDKRTDYATARITALQEAEAERRDRDLGRLQQEQQRKTEIENQLKRASERFEEVKGQRDSDLRSYLERLSGLADAYERHDEKEKAKQIRTQVFNDFLSFDPKKLKRKDFQSVLSCLKKAGRENLTQEEVSSYFQKIATLAESNPESELLPEYIYDFLDSLREDTAAYIKAYEDWIAARAKVKGERDDSLDWLINNLMYKYQEKNNRSKVDELLEKRKNLITTTAEKRFQRGLNIAEFLFNAKRPKEAEASWKQAGEAYNWILSEPQVVQFFSVAKRIRRAGYDEQAQKMEDMALSHPTKDNINSVDLHLMERLNKLVEKGDYAAAEKLARKHLADTKDFGGWFNNRPWWESQLTEIYSRRGTKGNPQK